MIKLTGLVLVILSFLLLIAFFATFSQGSESLASASGDLIQVPLLTDTILYWLYLLFALAILITLVVAVSQFVKGLIHDTGKALKSLVPIVLFALVFVVSYLLGSGERMSIIGYEGTQNEGIWAQLTDMMLYTVYTLMIALVVTIFGSRIYTALK